MLPLLRPSGPGSSCVVWGQSQGQKTGRRRSDDGGRTDGPLVWGAGVLWGSELRGPYAHSLSSTPAGMDPAHLNRHIQPRNKQATHPNSVAAGAAAAAAPADLAPRHPVPPQLVCPVQIRPDSTTRASTGRHRSTQSLPSIVRGETRVCGGDRHCALLCVRFVSAIWDGRGGGGQAGERGARSSQIEGGADACKG